jgi:hypothetical protein
MAESRGRETVRWRDRRRLERGVLFEVVRGGGIYRREAVRGSTLSINETAAALGLNTVRIYRLIRAKKLKTVRRRQRMMVPFGELVRIKRELMSAQ